MFVPAMVDGQIAKFSLTYVNKLNVIRQQRRGRMVNVQSFLAFKETLSFLFFLFFKVQLSLYQMRPIQPKRSGV